MTNLVPNEILQRVREYAAKGKTTPKKDFRRPTAEYFPAGMQILCFDQTLGNCGWALLNTDGGQVSVPHSGTIRPPILGHNTRGFELTLTRTVMLHRQLRQLVGDLYGKADQVVMEMPAVQGYRTESSLLAAATIWVALDEMGEDPPVLVSRQAAAATLCGDRHASKKASSDLVNRLVEDRRPKGLGQWTEHVRDAVFVGLKNLYQEET